MKNSLQCPECSAEMSLKSCGCDTCGFEIQTRYGISSFTRNQLGHPHLDDDEVARIAKIAEEESERDIPRALKGHERFDDIMSELFDGLSEDWRVLVPQAITGTCLDLFAGFGTRSLLLADHADSVLAVEPNIHMLRVLNSTEHPLRSKVTPLHTDEHTLPYHDPGFDTIVIDMERYSGTLSELLPGVKERLAGNGRFILKLSGITGRYLTERSKRSVQPSSPLKRVRTLVNFGLRHRRRQLHQAGFDTKFFALFPSSKKARFVFDAAENAAFRWLWRNELSNQAGVIPRKIFSLGERAFGVSAYLRYIYPSYLAVCSPSYKTSTTAQDGPAMSDQCYQNKLLIRGQRRAVVLNIQENEVTSIEKRPKSNRCDLRTPVESANERETRILRELRSRKSPITGTLPDGRLEETFIGPVRFETPAEGILLQEQIGSGVSDIQAGLSIALDWLTEFQNAYRQEPIHRSELEVKEDLSFEPIGLEAPEAVGPADLFLTASHGDYSPDNIFTMVNQQEVTTVIDWEGASLRSLPVLDATYCILSFITTAFGDFEIGVQNALLGQSAYSNVFRESISAYCNQVGIRPRTFLSYLSYPYIETLKNAYRNDSELRFAWGQIDPAARADYLNEHIPEIIKVLTDNNHIP